MGFAQRRGGAEKPRPSRWLANTLTKQPAFRAAIAARPHRTSITPSNWRGPSAPRRLCANYLAVEDVGADLGDPGALAAPGGGDVVGVVPKDIGSDLGGEVLAGDLGDGERAVPGVARRVRRREAAGADERELGVLGDDPADARRIDPGAGAVQNYLGDGELAFEALAARLEIDRLGEAELLLVLVAEVDEGEDEVLERPSAGGGKGLGRGLGGRLPGGGLLIGDGLGGLLSDDRREAREVGDAGGLDRWRELVGGEGRSGEQACEAEDQGRDNPRPE